MSDGVYQIDVVTNADGVDTGVRQAKQSLTGLAEAGQQAGRKASEGIGQIGQGAEKAAQQFDKSEKSIIASIQRRAAAMEAAGKGARAYQEALITNRGMDVAKFEPYLAQLDAIEKKQQAATSSALEMKASLADAFAGLAALAGVASFGALIKGAIDAADSFNDLSKSTSITVETLAGLKLASKQSGAELEGTAQAINKLSVNIGANAAKFAAIGVTAKEPIEAFKQLSDVFKSIDDPQQRAAFGAEALGKSWASAAPLLSEGSVRIQEMIDKGTALSGVTQGMADDADAFNDAMEEMRTGFDGVISRIAGDMLPVLIAMSADMSDVTAKAGSMDESFSPVTETLRAVAVLGGNVAFVLKGIGTEFGGMAAQVAAAASGNFAGAKAIGQMMKEDAAKARTAFDAWEAGVMNATKATKAASEETKKLSAAQRAAIDTFTGANDAAMKEADRAAKEAQKEADRLAKEAAKAALEAYKQRSELVSKMSSEEVKRSESIRKANESLREEIAMLGMSKEQQAQYKAAKLESAAASDLATAAAIDEQVEMWRTAGVLPEIIAGYEALAAAKRQSAASLSEQGILDSQKAAKEIAVDAAKESTKAWQKFGDEINQSLTDALYRAFESGESFGQAFAKTIKNTFKAMALKLAINYTVDSSGNLVNAAINSLAGSSGANNGSGVNYLGAANNASTAYNLYNNAGNYGSLAYQWATGSMSTANVAGTAYANATGTGLDGLLATNGAYGTATGAEAGSSASSMSVSSIGWIAAIVAGWYMSSEAWKNGIRWDNTYGFTQNPTQSGLHGALHQSQYDANKALFGKDFAESEFMQTITFSALSQQFSNMIWGGQYKPTGISSVRGTFSEADGGFSGQSGMEYRKAGGWFGSAKNTVQWQDIGNEFDLMMDGMYQSVRNSLLMAGAVFDDNSLLEKIKGFTYTINEANTNNMKGSFSAWTEQVAQELGQIMFPSIGGLVKSGETMWSQVFSRVISEANAVSRVFDYMGKTLSGVFGKDNADGILRASDNIVQLFGSIDALNSSFADYYGNFYTQSEQVNKAWSDLGKQFDYLGVTMPKTRSEFRALVDSLDLSGGYGQSMFASLMNLEGAFAALTPTIDDVAAAAKALVDANREAQAQQISKYLADQRDAQTSSIEDQISAAESIAETFGSIAESLNEYRNSLLLGSSSILSPSAQYAEAKRIYDETSAKARLGDKDAAGNLQSVASDFLAAALSTGTAESYARDFGSVMGTVDSVISVAERQVPIAEAQLETLNDILAALTGNQSSIVVNDYQKAASDWSTFFTTTAIGDVVQNAAGAMQRISDSMGMFIDKAGVGFTFSASDSPYALASQSDAWRQEMLSRYGAWQVPAFASGGLHSGGLRIVGENGPELEITGPSQILNNSETGSFVGSISQMVDELQALRTEVSMLREEQRSGHSAIASNTAKSARLLDKFDGDGMPEVRAA